MPKCGTSFVTRVLKASHGAVLAEDDRHVIYANLSEEATRDRAIVGIHRNPFDWYVSRWNYVCSEGYWKSKFKTKPTFDHWMDETLLRFQGEDHQGIPRNQGLAVGQYTFMHLAYHTINPHEALGGDVNDAEHADLAVDEWMRVESLSSDVVKVFGAQVKPHLNQWKNSYPHGDREYYYTESLVDRVRDLDRIVLDRFGYTFL